MKHLIVALALLAAPGLGWAADGGAIAAPSPLPAAITRQIADEIQTGSILATQGDCLAIRVGSFSSYTHVAAVVIENGSPMVYDTMPSSGARKLPLRDYLISQQPTDIQCLHPVKSFNADQAARFHRHLESQLGRRYDVKHYATGYECDGLHCSEYLTGALISTQQITANNPARVSPGSLVEGLTENGVYSAGTSVELPPRPTPPAPAPQTWYGRAWHSTSSCSSDCWEQTKRWFCCTK